MTIVDDIVVLLICAFGLFGIQLSAYHAFGIANYYFESKLFVDM